MAAALAPGPQIALWVTALSLVFLALLGAKAGGASLPREVARVIFRGAVAMAVTWAVGHVFGAVV